MFDKMFGTGDMIKAIAETNKKDRNVYLNAVDRVQESNAASQAQSINFLLSKTKTRSVGLRFLIEYLNQCPKNVLEKKANIWLTIIIRACNTNEVGLYGELIYEALSLLVFQIQVVPEIAKWFGATYLGKLYESLAILEKQIGKAACTVAALKAIQQCLKYYPGPSKSGKPLIVRYLLALVDSSDPEVVYKCGNCWLLLQQVRGSNEGNFNSKTQWQDYQLGLLGSLNALSIDAFRDHKSDYNTMDTNNKLEYFTLELQGDPIERVARVSRRFCNLIDFLKIALSQPYPSTKLMRPTKILDFIQHGLGLRNKIDVRNQSMDNVCLGNLLPTLHTKLFELLEVLIDTCHTHLRMHFRLITSILLESLNTTKWSSTGFQIEFCNLRVQVHKVTMLWISTLGEGSGCDLVADRLVRDILEDVMIRRTDIYLMSAALSKSGPQKKGKRSHSLITVPSIKGEPITNKGRVALCTHAFRCLQAFIVSIGYLLKSPLLKLILNTILDITVQISEKRLMMQNPYDDWSCRLELYKTLFTFIQLRNISSSTPRNIILYILDEAHKKDPSSDIRICCKSMIASVEKAIHPERESLILQREEQSNTNIIKSSKQIVIEENPIVIEENPIAIEEDPIVVEENPIDAQEIKDSYKNGKINSEINPPSMHYSTEEIPSMNIGGSELTPPGIQQKKFKNSKKNANKLEKSAIKDILQNAHEDDKKIDVLPKRNSDDSKQFSKVDLNPNNGISTNNQDDEYFAELNAAFVDELK